MKIKVQMEIDKAVWGEVRVRAVQAGVPVGGLIGGILAREFGMVVEGKGKVVDGGGREGVKAPEESAGAAAAPAALVVPMKRVGVNYGEGRDHQGAYI
jgi:hypothetical protein